MKRSCFKGCFWTKEGFVNKNNSHSKLDLESSTQVVYEQQRQALKILNQVQDDSMIRTAKAFTLIELLVVVLIIGILAAVAVPQYQVAVKKADLARYMSLVAAMKEAEEVYYLANGEYTEEIEQLDIGMPLTTTCELSSYKEYYDCGNVRMGILNGNNVQAGNNTIRYLQFFKTPEQGGYATKVKKGDIVCQARGSVAIKACQNLGGQEIEVANGWDKTFILK